MKRSRKHHHRPGRASGSRTFTAALLITMLVAVGAGAALLALNRMENTMSADRFTLFSLEKKPKGHYALTALDQEYDIDLSQARRGSGKLDFLKAAAPSGLKVFLLTVSGLVDGLGELIGRYGS